VAALEPAGGVRIRVLAQAPFRSGIGGSSSYGVALARALAAARSRELEDDEVVALIRDLEARVLGVPTGEQDHWAAVRGGVLALHLEPGANRLESLAVAPEWLAERATVFFTGIRHHSGMVNWQVIRRRLDGDRRARQGFAEITAAAVACRAGLVAGDETQVADAIRCDWKSRRRLAPEVSPPEMEELVEIARSHGASAVRACGAGGGGSILIWHPPGTREAITTALEGVARNGRVLSTGVATEGCRLLRA
jgi:D-glycero-alpha-D-manno-heptose-7-phosphate kinase